MRYREHGHCQAYYSRTLCYGGSELSACMHRVSPRLFWRFWRISEERIGNIQNGLYSRRLCKAFHHTVARNGGHAIWQMLTDFSRVPYTKSRFQFHATPVNIGSVKAEPGQLCPERVQCVVITDQNDRIILLRSFVQPCAVTVDEVHCALIDPESNGTSDSFLKSPHRVHN